MTARVEWTQAGACPVAHAGPRDEMPDGQQIDQDKCALVLGGDCDSYLVVQGSPTELRAFAARVSETAMASQRGGGVAAAQPVVEVSQAEYDAGEAAFTRSGQDMGSERITEVEDVIRAVRPVVVAAAYTELADELTELAEWMRKNYLNGSARAVGLVDGVTVIRERAARLQGSNADDKAADTSLRCPECGRGRIWSTDDGAVCTDPDPDAGGAPGCGAQWDCVGVREPG